jgi:hypothetical protein
MIDLRIEQNYKNENYYFIKPEKYINNFNKIKRDLIYLGVNADGFNMQFHKVNLEKIQKYIETGDIPYHNWSEDDLLEINLLIPEPILREMLTRIGKRTSYDGKNTLYQYCHIIKRNGKYYLLHYLELLEINDRKTRFCEYDLNIRNNIANMLKTWNHIEIVNPKYIIEPENQDTKLICVLSKNESKNWDLWNLVKSKHAKDQF